METSETSMSSGRLKSIRGEAFCFAYGDGATDVDIAALIAHQKAHGCLAAMWVSRSLMSMRWFGDPRKSPRANGGWINGGFLLMESEVIDRIKGDTTIWEQDRLRSLAADGQLTVYRHTGF